MNMYIRSSIPAMIFRVMLIIICGAGIVMRLMGTAGIMNTVMGDFALIANVLAVIYAAYLIVIRPGYENGMLRGAVTVYMIVTFIVYYFVYFGMETAQPDSLSAAGYLLYFVAPVMVTLDYLLFCRKGEFSEYSPAAWTVLPVLFNAAVFIINRTEIFDSVLPYFSAPGTDMVSAVLVFLGIGYIMFIFDRLAAGRYR